MLQHWIYSVPIETWDIRDDTIGAFVGFVGAVSLFALAPHRRSQGRSSILAGFICLRQAVQFAVFLTQAACDAATVILSDLLAR